MPSPYDNLPKRAFWRTGVGERDANDPGDLYQPRWKLKKSDRVFTAGSCFAQHLGRALARAGVTMIDAEVLPEDLSEALKNTYGYGLFSARFGNIYTPRQLLQLMREAAGEIDPAIPVWEKGGRFFDAQRPTVEPEGLDSPEQVARHRDLHLARINMALLQTDVFVFTLGLTETWEHIRTGTVYPTAPGTVAGAHDPAQFRFKNFNAIECYQDLCAIHTRMKEVNPTCKFLLTVSPVPLTATASGAHVEVATAASKATLRAAAAMMVDGHPDVDYFPSYEIITSPNARGIYFKSNKRSVTQMGVETAMHMFLHAHGLSPVAAGKAVDMHDDANCEEALLDAFAK